MEMYTRPTPRKLGLVHHSLSLPEAGIVPGQIPIPTHLIRLPSDCLPFTVQGVQSPERRFTDGCTVSERVQTEIDETHVPNNIMKDGI